MDSRDIAFYTRLLSGEFDLNDQFTLDSLDRARLESNPPVIISTQSSQNVQKDHASKRGQRTRNFTIAEDLMIISALLNISTDAVCGNNQKKATYWERITDYFHMYKTFDSDRNKSSLMNHWSAIQIAVNRFCGCYAQIEGRYQSGVTDQDKINQARQLYSELYSLAFQFEHCWHELRYQPKWLENGQKKKTKTHQNWSPGVSSPSTPDSVNLEQNSTGDDAFVDLERPLGRKAEKERLRKNKKKGTESLTDTTFTLISQLREKREEASNKKLEILEEMRQYQRKKDLREEEKLQLEKEKFKLKKIKEEQKVMSMDTSNMSPIMASYYRKLQEDIVKKRVGSGQT